MRNKLIPLLTSAVGLLGFGVIVAEMLKKWELISPQINPLWVVAPILILYGAKVAVNSAVVVNHPRISKKALSFMSKTIHILLIIALIATILSIPFVWYGVIEQAARTAGVGKQ